MNLKEQCELCNRYPNKCDCENFISMAEVKEFFEWIWNIKTKNKTRGY